MGQIDRRSPRITGYVTDLSTGPLSGVTVTLSYINSSGQTVTLGSTTTLPDGSYSFGSLAAGTYTVTVTVPLGELASGPNSTTFSLAANTTDSGIDFYMLPATS